MPDRRSREALKVTQERIRAKDMIEKHVKPRPGQVTDEQVARARATPWTWGKGNKVP